jgi:transposase
MELRMSQKERDRLKVLEAVVQGRVSRERTSALLGISRRQLRRLLGRYQAEGDAGLVHRSRGRPSNRGIPVAVQAKAVECIRERYGDFGPQLASEVLAEREGIEVSRETVRRWMIEAGLWKAKRSRVRHHQWRARKECRGEMVQMDTSIHAWLEGRALEEPVLIAMIDDATSRLYARFFTEDSTRTNMTLLRDYIHRWGRPVALYADRASHFKTTRDATVDEQLNDQEPETQIGRALRQLDIRYIAASSPQAKGRIERCFRTLQDRLVKELRLRKISCVQEANDYLEQEFLPRWNRRFTQKPACSLNAHRGRKGFDLDAIFNIQDTRTVTNNYTVRFRNQILQIERRSVSRGLRGDQVIVEERLDGSLRIRWRTTLPTISGSGCLPTRK